jgi:hypothetical protein
MDQNFRLQKNQAGQNANCERLQAANLRKR